MDKIQLNGEENLLVEAPQEEPSIKIKKKPKPIPFENKLVAGVMLELSQNEKVKITKSDIAKVAKCSIGSVYNWHPYRIAKKLDFEKIDWKSKLDNLLEEAGVVLSPEVKDKILKKISLAQSFDNPVAYRQRPTTSDSDH